jgi:Tol biopolymer transport system component
MERDRRNQISNLYQAALARPPEERGAFLTEACAGDDLLRREVESLLGYESAAAEFLEISVVELAGTRIQEQVIGRQLGAYTILAPLGIGGMGEVYRARDTKLRRDVAIKILPSHFTADPERRTRFAREARLLATLNHSNVGAIYGLEETEGLTALVLELVEGPTLAERLARGPLTIPEALAIARQIGEALEAAHEKGIVHRDLKPANIVLQDATNAAGVPLGETRAKVLDFGLAKTMAARLGADLTQRPSRSLEGTAEGSILGTPAYMSPEQARGLAVDKRTDIWAFGCVLFEMLTGRRAFDGDTISDTFVSILERQPDWAALPTETAPLIRTVLQKCLRKDPRKRLHDIADALIEIEDDASSGAPGGAALANAADALRKKREWLAWAMAIALGVALVGVALFTRHSKSQGPTDAVTFTIDAPMDSRISSGQFAISPDGRQIVFALRAQGERRLWVRSLDTLELRRLPGTEGAANPFWKPDSQAVGFFANGLLKSVRLNGGAPISLCRGFGQGAWNQDDVIVFGGNRGLLNGFALQRVSAWGGTPAAITSLTGDEFAHGSPSFLPDGQHFLYVAQRIAASDLRVGSLTSEASVSLGSFESNAEYAAGYLFSVRDGSLIAQRFDAETHRLQNSSSYIAAKVGYNLNRGMFSVSATGRLAYSVGSTQQRLTWVDRQGKVLTTVGDAGSFFNIDLSPDEEHVAVSRSVQRPGARAQVDIWRIDLARSGLATRLTDDPGQEWDPRWSPDGTRIAFTHAETPASNHNLFVRPADASGQNTPLSKVGNITTPDWSHDGRFILYTEDASGPGDLWTLSMAGDRAPIPLVKTQHGNSAGAFSPDDRWVAFQSDVSGRLEVYVRPFPAQAGEFPISREGGGSPRWRGDGKELFYLALDGTMMAVSIDAANPFRAGTPKTLFPTSSICCGGRPYAVTNDGQRFLMAIPEPSAPIVALLNWPARLTK